MKIFIYRLVRIAYVLLHIKELKFRVFRFQNLFRNVKKSKVNISINLK
jgi:hypothetical protein